MAANIIFLEFLSYSDAYIIAIPFYITAEKINSSLFSYYYVAYFNKVSSTLIYDKIYY